MPIDSSGLFTRAYNWVTDKANGTKIVASRMDGEFDNFASAVNAMFFRSGLVAMTGALKMGVNPITGLSAGLVGTPSIAFDGMTATGFYSPALNTAGVAANGALLTKWGPAGTTIYSETGVANIVLSGGGIAFSGDGTFNGNVTLTSTKTIFGNPTFDAAASSVVAYAATIQLDLRAKINPKITATGNVNFSNPTSLNVGEFGTITFRQDATGGRVPSFGTSFVFAGGVVPTFTLTPNGEDTISYYVETATRIKCGLLRNFV